MTSEKAEEIDRLRVLIWAYAVLAWGDGTTSFARRCYPASASGRESTLFNKSLAEGRPWPSLLARDGTQGPALKLEEKRPGTLVWLIHPVWSVLRLPDWIALRDIYSLMLAMRAEVRAILFQNTTTSQKRQTSTLTGQIKALGAQGCLDSLLAIFLIAREAFLYCDADSHGFITQCSREVLPSMRALAWMPHELRDSLVSLVLLKIEQQAPMPLEKSLEDLRRVQQVLLDFPGASSSRHMSCQQIMNEISAAFESTGEIKITDNTPLKLSPQTKETLLKFIEPWMREGSP